MDHTALLQCKQIRCLTSNEFYNKIKVNTRALAKICFDGLVTWNETKTILMIFLFCFTYLIVLSNLCQGGTALPILTLRRLYVFFCNSKRCMYDDGLSRNHKLLTIVNYWWCCCKMAYPINIQIKYLKWLPEYQGRTWYVRYILYSFHYINSTWRNSDIYKMEEHIYLCILAFIRLCPLPLPLACETESATVANTSEGTRRISLMPLNIQRIVSLCVLQSALLLFTD